MSRRTLAHVTLASAAIVAAAVWLGVAFSTATAVVFMVLYALHTWRPA